MRIIFNFNPETLETWIENLYFEKLWIRPEKDLKLTLGYTAITISFSLLEFFKKLKIKVKTVQITTR